MKKRLFCQSTIEVHKGRVTTCRKVLADCVGDEFIEKEGIVYVKGLKEVTLKCRRKGCWSKTTLVCKEDMMHE